MSSNMRLNQKIYTIYGWVTIIKQRYSALQNKVVWVGIDEQGQEQEVDDSMVRPAPQNAPTSDSIDLMAIGKAFNLKKGDKGDIGLTGRQGIQGIKGDKGDRGEKGDSIKGDKGDRGEKGIDAKDGKDGKNGKDGDSAYKIAVSKGFAGTKAQWLKSLIGKDGKDGADGKDGLDGRDGLNGGGGIHKIDDATD